MKPELHIFRDAGLLAEGVAGHIAETLGRTERPSLVLSGGTTPRMIYRKLARAPYREQIAWGSLRVFWGDERCVAPEDPESNFRMAREAMLDHVPVRDVYRIEGERSPEEAAECYEESIRTALTLAPGQWPGFSLVLLGLGEDGHTASLFPGTSVLEERDRMVASVLVPRLGVHRVTLTVPALSHAREILVVVAGKAKAAIVCDVLEGENRSFPINRIAPVSGRLLWYLDAEAASLLSKGST
jgi:6-phosphogluconolactonase